MNVFTSGMLLKALWMSLTMGCQSTGNSVCPAPSQPRAIFGASQQQFVVETWSTAIARAKPLTTGSIGKRTGQVLRALNLERRAAAAILMTYLLEAEGILASRLGVQHISDMDNTHLSPWVRTDILADVRGSHRAQRRTACSRPPRGTMAAESSLPPVPLRSNNAERRPVRATRENQPAAGGSPCVA